MIAVPTVASAAEIVRDGVSLQTIRKRLGHRKIQTTLAYADHSDQAADDELRAWRRRARPFRDARILICDEPTASLDPRAEIEAFERIRRLAGDGHTVVLITHRLASVRHADHIYVLHRGRVLEHGDHAGLMTSGGTYAQLFALQAAQYGII